MESKRLQKRNILVKTPKTPLEFAGKCMEGLAILTKLWYYLRRITICSIWDYALSTIHCGNGISPRENPVPPVPRFVGEGAKGEQL